ncbi:hypothetical protein CDAR_554651 [Caerostris darwini]|uniref:Uncharacterized protein n=1 Tax=Caerostris darwini TaxID=1538125 RepID=A0AAV4TS94_9ARAC|nr:hypothetical protein CDAR_554651 [Caerostris darwini]
MKDAVVSRCECRMELDNLQRFSSKMKNRVFNWKNAVPTPIVTVKVISNEVRREGIMESDKIIDWEKLPIRIERVFLLRWNIDRNKSNWIGKVTLDDGGLDGSKRRSRDVMMKNASLDKDNSTNRVGVSTPIIREDHWSWEIFSFRLCR